MDVLIAHKAPLETRDVFGRTALMLASGSGHVEAVRLLLRRGADADSTDQHGLTAMEMAVAQGQDKAALLIRVAKLAEDLRPFLEAAKIGDVATMHPILQKIPDAVDVFDIGMVFVLLCTADAHTDATRTRTQMGPLHYTGPRGTTT